MAEIAATVGTASNIQMNYMKLLITQLQNQNPLEPMNNNEMAAQLSQFSSLQQLEEMNTSFADILSTTEKTYANSLIGKEVSFMTENEEGSLDMVSGIVKEVFREPDGKLTLFTEAYSLSLDAIVSVKN